MLFLDILTKTEERAEGLRSRLIEMIEKENVVKAKIQRIESSLRPEQLRNSAALVGSLRPETVREERSRVLNEEKANLESLLLQISQSRTSLENAVESADRLVNRVRARFEQYVERMLEEDLSGS